MVKKTHFLSKQGVEKASSRVHPEDESAEEALKATSDFGANIVRQAGDLRKTRLLVCND